MGFPALRKGLFGLPERAFPQRQMNFFTMLMVRTYAMQSVLRLSCWYSVHNGYWLLRRAAPFVKKCHEGVDGLKNKFT